MATKVWIDQDLCTGDGLCVEIAPDLFEMHDDGLAYVKEREWTHKDEGGKLHVGPDGPEYQMSEGMANVPDDYLEVTIEAAEECPGECIFIEDV